MQEVQGRMRYIVKRNTALQINQMVADCGKLGGLFRLSPFLKALGKSFQPSYAIAHYLVHTFFDKVSHCLDK